MDVLNYDDGGGSSAFRQRGRGWDDESGILLHFTTPTLDYIVPTHPHTPRPLFFSTTPSTTTVTSTRATSTVSRMRTVGFRKFRWHAASQYLSFFLPRERDVTNLTATCRAKTIICQAIAATDLGLTCFTISRNPSSVTWFTTPPSNRRENRKNHHEDTINGRNGR